MIYKKIPLDKNDENAYLECYVANELEAYKRKAILVIPGGGYAHVSRREGEPVAMAFMPYGYNAFVLHYSCKSYPFPKQLIQASMAMKHIRDNAKEYGIDGENLFVVGFSAGGHLAGSLATMWDREEIYKELDMPKGYNKPKGAMLIYPVVNDHLGSFQNLLLKENVTDEDIKNHSISELTGENSCPMFIFHTSNDQIVNVKNSLDLANKLAEQNIKFELHIFPDSPHGASLYNEITFEGNAGFLRPRYAKWVEMAAGWADEI